MQCNFSKANTMNFQAFDQFPTKVHSSCWCSYRTFVLGIHRLIALAVFFIWFTLDVFRQWSFTHAVQYGLEFLIITVEQEANRSTTRGGIVNYFSHQFVIISKIELIPYPYLTGRIYDNIPQTVRFVEFPE